MQVYKAYVCVMKSSFVYYLDIQNINNEEYKSYPYTFMSEDNPIKQTGKLYQCRMNGVEFENGISKQESRDVYHLITNLIKERNGWVNITIDSIDIYGRLLITLFDVISNKEYNSILLNYKPTNRTIVKKYVKKDIKITLNQLKDIAYNI